MRGRGSVRKVGEVKMASLEWHDCMHVLNGLVVPKFVQQEVLDKLRDLSFRDDDVWIVTYPKAGTTWTQYIQGVVTAICSVLPAATAIKVKSRDQAHGRAMIKGSRWRSGHKCDQNQNKMPDVVYTLHTLKL